MSSKKLSTPSDASKRQLSQTHRPSEELLASVSFDDEENDPSKKPNQPSQTYTSGLRRTGTPGNNSLTGSVNGLSAQSYLSGAGSKTRNDSPPPTNEPPSEPPSQNKLDDNLPAMEDSTLSSSSTSENSKIIETQVFSSGHLPSESMCKRDHDIAEIELPRDVVTISEAVVNAKPGTNSLNDPQPSRSELQGGISQPDRERENNGLPTLPSHQGSVHSEYEKQSVSSVGVTISGSQSDREEEGENNVLPTVPSHQSSTHSEYKNGKASGIGLTNSNDSQLSGLRAKSISEREGDNTFLSTVPSHQSSVHSKYQKQSASNVGVTIPSDSQVSEPELRSPPSSHLNEPASIHGVQHDQVAKAVQSKPEADHVDYEEPNESDVIIEGSYTEELDPDIKEGSREDVLFTVLTAVQPDDPSADSFTDRQSVSSSTAELLQVINSKEMEFDADEFTATSTQDGRTLDMKYMTHGRADSFYSQTSEEELRSYMFSPPPGGRRMSSDKSSPSNSTRPSILKQRTSFPDMTNENMQRRETNQSSSKVKFQDEIQTSYIRQSEPTVTNSLSWKTQNGEQLSLELPHFTTDCPSHLSDATESSNAGSVHVNEEDPKYVSSSKLRHEAPKRGRFDLESSSHPAYLQKDGTVDLPSHKSTSGIAEKDVKTFVEEVIRITRFSPDGLSKPPFAMKNGKPVTPSKLYAKIEDRRNAEEQCIESSSPSYTTPSELLVKHEAELSGETGKISGQAEDTLLKAASALLSNFESGCESDWESKSSLQRLLQDVKLLADDLPGTASTPIYTSASVLLEKLDNRMKYKESPSLTATYLEYLNSFEPLSSADKDLTSSEQPKGGDSLRLLIAKTPHSTPVFKSNESTTDNAELRTMRKFLTDVNMNKRSCEDSSNSGDLPRSPHHGNWDRIWSWRSLNDGKETMETSKEALFGSFSSAYPDDTDVSAWSSKASNILSSVEMSKVNGKLDDTNIDAQPLDQPVSKSLGTAEGYKPTYCPKEQSTFSKFQHHMSGVEKLPRPKDKTRNQVLVNQAIVDMVNAVSLYEHHMSGRGSQKDNSAKKDSLPVSDIKVQNTPPDTENAHPIFSPDSDPPSESTDLQSHSSEPMKPATSTELIINCINGRLSKMKAADDKRSSDIITEAKDNLTIYNTYGNTTRDPHQGFQSSYDSSISRIINQYVHPLNDSCKRDITHGQSNSPGTSDGGPNVIYKGTPGEEPCSEVRHHTLDSLPMRLYYGPVPCIPQKTGASLSPSRISSPDPATVIAGKTRKMGTGDVSKFLIEKEVIESQLRRLQVENSSLQTENKLLKEKFNRGQARIAQLESQIRSTQQEVMNMNDEISDKMSQYKRFARDRTEKDLLYYQERVTELTQEVELIKNRNTTLQKQLTDSRRSADMMRSGNPSDRSRIIESFKVDIFSLKDEVKRAQQLLAESERAREQEAQRRKDALAQVVKLTEMKALLQQQLESEGGGTVAEKQVKSLERRLKITEDRLHQERADRASKLSDVEEKLIYENARLQVIENELKRQLTRERERHRSVDQKHKDLRDENERLRVQLADKPMIEGININTRPKKHQVDEFKYLLDHIKREDNLGPGQEQEIIWLLWQRKDALAKQLKAWEIALDDVKVEHGNITQGLKLIRDERGMLEERISRYKDTLDDVTKEKDEMETLLKSKISDLTHTKHSTAAKVQNVEDLNTAITAENDSLRASLKMTSGATTSKCSKYNTSAAQLEDLKAKVLFSEANAEQKDRQARLFETELRSFKTRLSSKEKALEEALSQISRLQAGHMDGGDLLDRKQQQIDKLTAEIRGLQTEVKLSRDKINSANKERSQLEEQVEELNKFKSRAKFTDGSSSHLAESEKLALETELHEKDNQLLKVTIKYNHCENELQRSKRQYLTSHQQIEKIELQLDQLQAQLRQKTRMLERTNSADSDRSAQVKALRENLSTTNRELSEKTAQLRILESEHDILKDKLARFETAVLEFEGTPQTEAQRRIFDVERDSAKRDLDRANVAMNMIIRENSEIMSRVRELRQELVKERTQLCQVTSDKVDLEQQLHIYREERDSLQAEKDRLQKDLNKVSSDTSQSIFKLETDVHKSSSNYEANYHSLNQEGKKMAIEIGTFHKLLEAREKEAILLKDTIERQKDESQSLNRKIEILHEENVIGRDNIDRLTNELTFKIKEHASTCETNQSLASEKNRLQVEKLHLEKDVGHGGSEMERRLNELQELTKKLDRAEERFRDAERLVHQKETALVALQTEVKHLNRNNSLFESDRTHLKSEIEKLNDENRSLRSTNSSLEQSLSSEKSVLNEEKTSVRQLNQELSSLRSQIESTKRDHNSDQLNLDVEQKKVQSLQTAREDDEAKICELVEEVKNKQLEIDALKGHFAEQRNTIEQYKKDKHTLYQDVQELCRKLADKDETISRLQEKNNETMGFLQKDFSHEKSFLNKEKEKLELDLDRAKQEIGSLNEMMKRKELQLEAFVRTNQDLDNERRVKQDLETHILRLEGDLKEARQTLNMLNMESKRKAEEHRLSQDALEKAQSQHAQLKETFKIQREQWNRDMQELKQTLTEETHKHELEKNKLNEEITMKSAKLYSTELSLASVTENKVSLHEGTKGLERSLETLRSQLHEEITARKLGEHKAETFKSQIDDLRAKKVSVDERNMELQASYAKLEAECKLEKDKYHRLKLEISDERSTSSNAEAHAQVLHSQLTDLQAEISSLRSQLESQKQSLQGKNKRLTLDMKQQTENFDKERSKLLIQIQQISLDLENTREQVAAKNREQLKLQEEILSLEEKYREAVSDLKHVKESLSIEEQHRQKLEFRNQELELKLRSRYDDDSDASRLDSTRSEINKMMAEMKRKMDTQLEQSKQVEKDLVTKHQQQIEEHKRKITNLDSSLSQERSMHIVTKTQLSSLEDDNQRLRSQLQVARKRVTPPEERTKSRMEEINEIIARSQTRAQQMLASGVYGDDPLRTSGRELLSPIPMMHLNSSLMSEGNKSLASDDFSKDL